MTAQITSPNNPGHTASWYAWSANDKTIRPTLEGALEADICVVGGISEMRRIATLAEAHFVSIAPHNPMEPLATAVNVHFSAAQQNFLQVQGPTPSPTAPAYWRRTAAISSSWTSAPNWASSMAWATMAV